MNGQGGFGRDGVSLRSEAWGQGFPAIEGKGDGYLATPYFTEMIESLDIVAVLLDKTARLVYCNSFLLSLTGVAQSDAVGRDWFEMFVPAEDRQEGRAIFRRLMNEKNAPRMHRGRLRIRFGEPRAFSWTDSPLCGESGKLVGVARVGVDITEALETRQALKESESRFRELTRSIDDVFWMSEWASGKLLFVNPAFERVFGRSVDMLRENSLQWLEAVHPEDRARAESFMRAPLPQRRVDAVLRIVMPSKEVRWIHLRAHTLEANDSRPTVMVGVVQDITRRHRAEQRILKLNAQLEQRVDKRTQELADTLTALRERESAVLQESAINQGVARVASAIISLDRALPEIAHIVLEEASRLTGCRTGFVAERNPDTHAPRVLAVSPNPSYDIILNTEQRALLDAPETLLTLSNANREKNKGFFTNHPHLHPMFATEFDPASMGLSSFLSVPAVVGGELLGELCLANKSGGFSDRDFHICEKLADLFALSIAHIRRAEELEATKNAAEAASQAKSQFLSTMSHELRSPLNVIIGLTDVLSGSCRDEQQRSHIESIHSASASLLRLVNEVLDLARIEAGRVEIEILPIDVAQLVNELRGIFEMSAAQKGLVLNTEIDPGTPLLFLGDVNRLRQILMNLVSNAVKFTPAGTIDITVSSPPNSEYPDLEPPKPGALLRFSVLDTGIGIPHGQLESIFEGFTQVDASVARRFGGSGLGLAIARNLADLFGGKLTVTSTFGQGSRFDITVPLAMATGPCEHLDELNDSPPGSAMELSDTPLLSPIEASRVLLVEDSEDNQRVVSAFLENTAVTLDIASNGFDAFKLFERTRYNLVLMDIQMPLLDGLSTTRLLRQWELHSGVRRTPIVGLSAHAVSGASSEAMAAGCDDYLTKPVRKERFLGAVSRYLRKKEPLGSGPLPEQSPRPTGIPKVPVDEGELNIETDPSLAPYLGDFLRSVRRSASDIQDLLEQGDFQRIAGIGHKLKGDGGTYGLGKVTELGQAFQLAASRASGSSIEGNISALLEFVDKVAARRDIRLS